MDSKQFSKLGTVAELLVTYANKLTGEAGEDGDKAFYDYSVVLDTFDSQLTEFANES